MPATAAVLVYLLGPFVLALLAGRSFVRAPLAAFLLGLPTFLLAWVCIDRLLAAGEHLAPVAANAFWPGRLRFAFLAGLVEESARYVALRFWVRWRNERGGGVIVLYALGHGGMENLLKAWLFWSSAGLTRAEAIHNLFGAMLIHTCFTALVWLALTRGRFRYLVLAMSLHFLQDAHGPAFERWFGPADAANLGTVYLWGFYPGLLLWAGWLVRTMPKPDDQAAGRGLAPK